ncbi:hypothetical protein MHI24_24050 [Paenibacillus sp. FSL K6-1096]|uniref:hypothetical protein n=1 Tax=Paenibacillus sp. FSL K6-1096 TaxID=2921460 RepID=UPI0030ED383C
MMGSLLFAGAVIIVAMILINRSNRNARYKNYGNRTRSHSGDHYFITGTGADAANFTGNSQRDEQRNTDSHSGASHHHGHHGNHSHDHGHHHGGSSWDSSSHGGGDFGGGGDSGGGDSGGGGGD